MALSLEIVGSTVRDFCMLERNFFAHFKLVMLLMLLSSTALLGVRLPDPSAGSNQMALGDASLPVAIIELVAALATTAAAIWEYHSGVKDLLRVKTSCFTAMRVHFLIMMVVTALIVAACVIYLVYSE